jgi:hypothetical protein
MIALADGLPLVQLDDGRCVAFQRDWLLRGLAHAGAKAGYSKWWLAEHVAESVMAYLMLQFEENTITIPALTQAVASALQVIGYAEVAAHFAPGLPGATVSLEEMAQEAGTGYELFFFQRLAGKLQTLLDSGTTYFDLVGLAPCVKRLRSRKCWSRECEALRSEIVDFVRNQTEHAPGANEITVQLR